MMFTHPRLMASLLLCCCILAGCKNLVSSNGGGGGMGGNFTKPNTAGELVAQLNKFSQPIQSLESDSIDITVTQNGQPFGLNGRLAYQKERNFRMTASAIGNTEADLGSNSQEFWFYMKRNDPPDLFYCAYNDLPQAQVKLPLQPDWIAEALCVQEMNPSEYTKRDVSAGIELVKTVNHNGEQLYKGVLVATSGDKAGKVILHRLFRSNGQEIWRAEITDYQRERDIGRYTLPFAVKITCPEHKVVVELKLKGLKVNQLAANPALFQRPQGYRSVDIARLQPGGVPANPITRVGN